MAATMGSLPAQIRTQFNYYLDVDQGGSRFQYPGTAGDKLKKYDVVDAYVTDLRSCEESFTLDKNGFQLVEHHGKEKTYEDEARVKDESYKDTAEMLKAFTGASRVVPFSHIIRRHTYQDACDLAKKAKDPKDIVPVLNPAMFCHVDQSYDGAVQVLRDNMPPEEGEKLAKTRWGIINCWRPIGRAVQREPIGVCDYRSMDEADLRPVMAILPRKGGTFDNVSKGEGFETWNIVRNPKHKWYYASQMTPDEVMLIKCFDSKTDRARLTAHSAFKTEYDRGPARQSIETRCLVFWEDQE